jgi:antitoxin MazE
VVSTISNWGNSQGLRLPKELMKELSLLIGDKVKIFIENQKIVLEPIKDQREKFDINKLVKQIPSNYKANETINDKIGKEEW